jgi:hypothetical protein
MTEEKNTTEKKIFCGVLCKSNERVNVEEKKALKNFT